MRRLIPVLLAFAAAVPAQEAPPVLAARFEFLTTPPRGLPVMPAPADYAPNAAMFALGEALFHDRMLSVDRSVSCASCHPAANGFASPLPLPVGAQGRRARRHAPALWNRGYGTSQRWDGGTADLETFVLQPIADADEMALPIVDAVARLAADEGYVRAFAMAFEQPPSDRTLQRALATFVRGIARGDAPYDRFVGGDAGALTAEQRTGLWVFESKGGCWQCHPPPLFTDERFHNTGVGVRDGVVEPGRAAVTGRATDSGRWKTPTLRGARLTAPYMHDGSLATLDDVVAFYVRGGNANEHRDSRMRAFELTDIERAALVAFLASL